MARQLLHEEVSLMRIPFAAYFKTQSRDKSGFHSKYHHTYNVSTGFCYFLRKYTTDEKIVDSEYEINTFTKPPKKEPAAVCREVGVQGILF